MLPDQQMGPAMHFCAGTGRIHQEGEEEEEQQQNLIRLFWSRGEPTESRRLNRNYSNTQLIPNFWRRRSSKLMHFLDDWKQILFPKKWKLLKALSSLLHALMDSCPKEILKHVGLFSLTLNDSQLMCFSIWRLTSFLLPATTSQCIISQHLPLCLFVFKFGRN